MDTQQKSAVVKEYGQNSVDTGSVEVQVALLTARISELTGHLQVHKKDTHTRVGLLKLVGRRRRLLNYVSIKSVDRYKSLIGRLGLRR